MAYAIFAFNTMFLMLVWLVALAIAFALPDRPVVTVVCALAAVIAGVAYAPYLLVFLEVLDPDTGRWR